MRGLFLTGVGALAVATATPAPGQVYQAIGVPGGHMPPPGQCRAWYPDRPPGHQPPPTDCRSAAWQAQRYGGRLIWGGDHPGYGGHGPYGQYGNQGWQVPRERVCVLWDRWGQCVRQAVPGQPWNPDWRGWR